LGQDIISRRNNRLELTPKAREFAETIRTALGMIQSATQDLQFEEQANTLTLGILPAFGMRWLMPKLGDFSKQHPDITINMLTRLAPFSFAAEPIDAALHFGDANWANASSMRLKSEYVVPVCRPDYFDHPPTLGSLAASELLQIMSRPTSWSDWFNKQGYHHDIKRPTTSYDQFSTIHQAVLAGLGVALMPNYLVEEDLARGVLICPCDGDGQVAHSYYLVWPKRDRVKPAVRKFRDWLAGQVEGEDPYPR
jgi:LysR family glycine cleavage system transcriptional activator